VAIPPPGQLNRISATAGSVVFFAVAPGVVAGVVPWWLTGWRFVYPVPLWAPIRVVGLVTTAAAAVALVAAFARFILEGAGTPSPIAPPEHLVVGGQYRYVRNPMYVAVIAAIVGQALLFGQLGLVAYAAIVAALMFAFVRLYEEPNLAERFGEDYETYRRNVPGWLPRLTPWKP
jgi:protein-S-isoprenylcysteine O-methyltransferase Ste14